MRRRRDSEFADGLTKHFSSFRCDNFHRKMLQRAEWERRQHAFNLKMLIDFMV